MSRCMTQAKHKTKVIRKKRLFTNLKLNKFMQIKCSKLQFEKRLKRKQKNFDPTV